MKRGINYHMKSKEQDFLCNIIECIMNKKGYSCTIRHKYRNTRFRLIRSLFELKSIKIKTIVEDYSEVQENLLDFNPDLVDKHYDYRGLWLCYDIFKPATCDICGSSCTKDINIHYNKSKHKYFKVCNYCAFIREYSTNPDVCINCKNAEYCGHNKKLLKEVFESRKEAKRIASDIKNSMKNDKNTVYSTSKKAKRKKNKRRKK